MTTIGKRLSILSLILWKRIELDI
jgi:hypothetical protein